MLEIKPVQTKEEQKRICERCALPFLPDAFAYRATEGDALLAAAQFDIGGENAVLFGERMADGIADDWEALFILGRGVLNFFDLCHVKYAVFEAHTEWDEKLARILGFKKDAQNVYRIALEGLFYEPCKHGQSMGDHAES